MQTYQMTFNATIESIDTEQLQMIVEYIDPHGHNNIRLGVRFSHNSTEADLKQLIIDHTPHLFFHEQNKKITEISQKQDELSSLRSLVGLEINYNLESFPDSEVI